MKRYTVKAFTIESKWIEYSTNDRAKALACALNVTCVRVFDNQGESPKLILTKGQEADVGKEYLLNNFPAASKMVDELLN